MNEQNQFDWVDFYKELSSKLLQYKNNRKELINKIRKIYEITGINLPTLEKDNQIVDIDPFRTLDLYCDFTRIKAQLDSIASKYLLSGDS